MLIHHDILTRFITEIFVRLHADPVDAGHVASHLVAANLKGHDSHGVGMVPTYVRNIRSGALAIADTCTASTVAAPGFWTSTETSNLTTA